MPEVGDVVVITRIRKTQFNGHALLLFGDFTTKMAIFSVAGIPDQVIADPESSIPPSAVRRYPKQNKRPVDRAEERCAIMLWQWALKSDPAIAQKIQSRAQLQSEAQPRLVPLAAAPRRKPSLLKDVKHGDYYILVGEVVKMFTRDMGGGKLSLYVTDYTMNSQFYSYAARDNDSSANQWETLPEGKYTLQITLWEPHAQFICDHAKTGSFVRLRNVNVVYRDQTQCLEGKLHGDKVHPDRINVQVLDEDDPMCKEIMARREQFHVARAKADSNKSKKKRQKKKQKKGQELRERASVKPEASDPFAQAHRVEENRHIVAAHADKPLHTLHSIIHSPQLHGKTPEGSHITYPLMLAKFRARVRVVDFYPPKLEDFSRSLQDPEFNDCSAEEDWRMPRPSWEWAFYLLVEDAHQDEKMKERMKLVVAGPEAEYLLNLTASE
jgi:protection of telomeres protein 1